MPRGEAVRIGEAIREQAIVKYRDQLPAGHRAIVYNLRGREIEAQEAPTEPEVRGVVKDGELYEEAE